jgi:hypothetical protein
VSPDHGSQPSLVTEVIGWLGFVLFVGAVWKLRQTLDRTDPGQ